MSDDNKKTKLPDIKKIWNQAIGLKSRAPISFYVLFLLLAGILFMIVGNPDSSETNSEELQLMDEEEREAAPVNAEPEEEAGISSIETVLQGRMKEMLENITGVGGVAVMVKVAGTEKNIYEKNSTISQQTTTEKDREGGERKLDDGTKEDQIVIIRNGDKEEPLIQQTIEPDVEGVLVVAEGAGSLQVKEMIVEAVSRALDIAPHKVSVMPRNDEGGNE
ncbi:stage III sporulation protein AG [Alteribacillus sp. HJP-4]|uniref:stage III sporulation protein AG n=1 Tax=Alteribacillus sp. HJP-4 TaxID=2775394 RepID=UPI0035CD0CBE